MSDPPRILTPDTVAAVDPRRPTLRLLSYNIQVGIATRRMRDYFTQSWKHLLHHPGRARNLDLMAEIIAGHDIVGLQETDAGSLRSGNVNLTEYLAQKAGLPFWHHKVNRSFGRYARHAHGLISRMPAHSIDAYPLPGLIPGRGVVVARYEGDGRPLSVFHAHLGLTRSSRRGQLAFIAEMLQDHPDAILMGDFNTPHDSPEMREFFARTGMREPAEVMHTFPSWQPSRNIDHVLVTPSLEVLSAQVLPHALSDHLPLSVEVSLPSTG
jgi:endonuclease/exonuclease/phosphatase family metal-dependent hydrolase